MPADIHDIRVTTTESFRRWLRKLNDFHAKVRIANRLRRLQLGHFGDVRPVGEGLFELRIDYGPGYRIYCGRISMAEVVVILGGDKRRQDVDIANAKRTWKEWEGKHGS